ncbi:MAG: PHP domain-containing protein [Desulfococcaceae bacterium]
MVDSPPETENRSAVPLALARSRYSLLRGTASVRDLCARARKLGHRRIALVDRDNIYGLWPFLAACRDQGLRPLVRSTHNVSKPTTPQHGGMLWKES